jgi:hypothetical protein
LTPPAVEPAVDGGTRSDPTPPPPAGAAVRPLDLEAVFGLWPDLIRKVGVRLGVPLSRVEPGMIAISGPNLLVFRLGPSYNWVGEECGAPEARTRIEAALGQLLDRPITIQFDRLDEEDPGTVGAKPPATPGSSGRRPGDLEGDPMVQKVVQLFEARPVHLEVEEERETSG